MPPETTISPATLPPQVICRYCTHIGYNGLTPTEAAEVGRCRHFKELRNINFVRRCAAFQKSDQQIFAETTARTLQKSFAEELGKLSNQEKPHE